jgi:hypothetical protein
MKKIVLLISLVIAAATLNAQDFYIGGGFDKAFIVYPDNSVKAYNELVVCGQYDKLDLMFGIELHEKIEYTKRYTFGLYVGRNVSRFSFGGYFGYDFAEYDRQNITIQYDMLLLGVYAKYSILDCMKVFAFYKVGYDNNNSYSKFCDRGFGIGITIGFGHSDKEYTTKYYYN